MHPKKTVGKLFFSPQRGIRQGCPCSALMYIHVVASEILAATTKNELNWSDKIDKLNKPLVNWSKKNLTLFGKILITKQLAMAQVIYLAQI